MLLRQFLLSLQLGVRADDDPARADSLNRNLTARRELADKNTLATRYQVARMQAPLPQGCEGLLCVATCSGKVFSHDLHRRSRGCCGMGNRVAFPAAL